MNAIDRCKNVYRKIPKYTNTQRITVKFTQIRSTIV